MSQTPPQFLDSPLNVDVAVDTHVQFGDLDLWLRREAREWRIATRYRHGMEDRSAEIDDQPVSEDAKPARWVTGDTDGQIRLRPVCPPRSVVVRPESQVSLFPGQSTDFYIGLPLWLELSTPKDEVALCELPAVKLSNSWFGEPTHGELCYAMRTLACSRAEDLITRIHRAICPLQVRNASDDLLTFERICLRCRHLNIFFMRGRYWTNQVRLTHLGQNEWSRVVYGAAPPAAGGEATLVTPPREPIKRGFLGSSLLTRLKPQI